MSFIIIFYFYYNFFNVVDIIRKNGVGGLGIIWKNGGGFIYKRQGHSW